MRLREAMEAVATIVIPELALPVEITVAEELEPVLRRSLVVRREPAYPAAGRLVVAVATAELRKYLLDRGVALPSDGEWIYFDLDEHGAGVLSASTPHFLYSLFALVIEDLIDLSLIHI